MSAIFNYSLLYGLTDAHSVEEGISIKQDPQEKENEKTKHKNCVHTWNFF